MKQGLLLSTIGVTFLYATPLLAQIEGGNVTTRVTPEQTINIEGASKDFNIQKGMPDPHAEEHFHHQIEPIEAGDLVKQPSPSIDPEIPCSDCNSNPPPLIEE